METFFSAGIKKSVYCVLWCAVHLLYRPKAFFINPELKKLPRPCILFSKHNNHVDGSLISVVFGKSQNIHFLAAKDRFEQSRFLSFLLHCLNCLPIDRKGLDTDWIHKSLKILKVDNDPVCIFPEGRCGKNGEILEFHSGVTALASLADVPLLPVYIEGDYKFFFGKSMKILVGDVFKLDKPKDGLTVEFINLQTEKMFKEMIALQQKMSQISNIE